MNPSPTRLADPPPASCHHQDLVLLFFFFFLNLVLLFRLAWDELAGPISELALVHSGHFPKFVTWLGSSGAVSD